jgi:hypothetical protein
MGCPRELLGSLVEMANAVFHSGMGEEFPHLFCEENLENCRVFVEGGRVVSHIGFTVSDATVLGAPLRVACLGAVGTYEECRGRGFATASFADCLSGMERQGVHVLMVSGDRNLYRRNHCMKVGRDHGATVDTASAAKLARKDLALSPVGEGGIDAVIEIHRREPVRFIRGRDFWLKTLSWLKSPNRGGDLLAVGRPGGEPEAYVVSGKNRDGLVRVIEYGGERAAVAGSLAAVIERAGAKQTSLHVPRWDSPMLGVLKSAGAGIQDSNATGTHRIIRFIDMMERLRPLFAERTGSKDAAGLKFAESGERFRFSLGGSELVLPDRDALVRVIYGTIDDSERSALKASPVGKALERCFPIPALSYGTSYV